MRRTIEHLAWEIQDAPPTITIGELARQFGETTERITDAIDVLKIRGGQPTQIPAVDWSAPPPSHAARGWVMKEPPLTIQTTIDHGLRAPDRRLYENRPPEAEQCWCLDHKARCTNAVPYLGQGGLCTACLHGCAP